MTKGPSSLKNKKKPQKSSGNWLLGKVGTNKDPEFNITHLDGSALPQKTITKFKKHFEEFKTSFNALVFSPTKAAKPHAYDAKSGIYKLDTETSGYAICIKQSPSKVKGKWSPSRLLFKQESPKGTINISPLSSSEDSRVEHFKFEVSKRILSINKGKKRPKSQKKANGGRSALDILKAEGLQLPSDKKLHSGRHYHLAHRKFHFVGGGLKKQNLDSITASGNYATLFKVEKPIEHVLKKGQTKQLTAEGKITFPPYEDAKVPCEIAYTVSSGKKTKVTTHIDPLDTRRPSVKEAAFARKLTRLELAGQMPLFTV